MTDYNPKYTDVVEMPDEEFMVLRQDSLKDRDISLYGGEFITEVWRLTYEYRGIK